MFRRITNLLAAIGENLAARRDVRVLLGIPPNATDSHVLNTLEGVLDARDFVYDALKDELCLHPEATTWELVTAIRNIKKVRNRRTHVRN